MNTGRACRLVVAGVTIQVLVAAPTVAADSRAASRQAAPSPSQVQRAAAWAAGRQGTIAWSVIDSGGRMRGRAGSRLYRSASVSKAMLLVAALRRLGDRPVPAGLHARLEPMIRLSGNRAARAVYPQVGGDAAFRDVARATGLRRLGTNGTWSELQISAADVARFFLRAERATPARHRAYARELLGGIVARQSWGIPRVLRPAGWTVLFKGGWHGGQIVHQGAVAERDGRRVAIAVLTAGSPTHDYGRFTIEGIARRLLAGPGA
jgi:Beta-lactamase enzyme family